VIFIKEKAAPENPDHEEEQRPENKENVVTPGETGRNYHITNDQLGVFTPKERYRRNVAAIHTLFQIESENRPATLEEQEILLSYTGWCSLSAVFDEFRESTMCWKKANRKHRSR
jgi:hypothetical protein